MNSCKAKILIIIFAFFVTSTSTAQKVEKILDQVEENIESTNYLSFNSQYVDIEPNAEDSVSKSSATIWLQKVPSDSVFGVYFHLDGRDRGDKVEYFYDGQNSYEIRHEKKMITIFHPHRHLNNPNNPAKARTALSPFNQLIINPDFKETILENHLKTSLEENRKGTQWIITITYRENKFGQKTTKTFFIDKDQYLIDQINQTVKWKGATYKTRYKFSNYNRNRKSISDKVFFQKSYANYSQEVHQRNSDHSVNPHAKFIGKSAPEFHYSSFSGSTVSLKKLKGKLVLLDFWETWCGYCIMAMPKLNALQKKYKKELNIIGITTENKEQVRKLIEANELVYSNIYATHSILDDYNISNRPTYVLIDRKGQIATVTYGDLEKIKTKINALLK